MKIILNFKGWPGITNLWLIYFEGKYLEFNIS